MKKNKLVFISLMLLMITGAGLSVFRFAYADDDDEYEDRYEEEDDSSKAAETSTESAPKPKTYQETVVVSPARIVTQQQLQTVLLSDRDRDGIVDSEDVHPDIAEIYIVQDENLNGIVDTFEYANQQ
jgi:hypothetical protein